MKISTTHQRFADSLRNQRALEHPEEFLGQNWKDVLNFWFLMDTLTEDQWKNISDAFYSLSDDECLLAFQAIWEAASSASSYDSRDAGFYAASGYVGSYATCEIMGSHILQEQGKSLVFFPLFLNV